MIKFNQNQFLNNIIHRLNKFGHEKPSSEFKYNFSKGLTSHFLILSANNKETKYTNFLSRFQSNAKENPNRKSIYDSNLDNAINSVIDIQSPLDNSKRYQEYALHACKFKIKKSTLNEKQLFDFHMFKEGQNITKNLKKTNSMGHYDNCYNYNDDVHKLAYQYFSNFKDIKCGKELIQNTTLNKVLLSKLLTHFPHVPSKPDIKLMRACLDIASKHMIHKQLQEYDEKMQQQGLLNAYKGEYKNLFRIDKMTKFKTELLKDITLAKTDNKEIAVQIFAKKDAVAAYISQSPLNHTAENSPSITTFEIFNPKKGTEMFYNVDEFLTALTKEVVHYNKKHSLPSDEVKYKKYYKAALPRTNVQEQTPSAPPLPQQYQTTNSSAPPTYSELFPQC